MTGNSSLDTHPLILIPVQFFLEMGGRVRLTGDGRWTNYHPLESPRVVIRLLQGDLTLILLIWLGRPSHTLTILGGGSVFLWYFAAGFPTVCFFFTGRIGIEAL